MTALGVYGGLSLIVSVALLISIQHVFGRAKYVPAGSLRYLVVWACVVNVLSAVLFVTFGSRWRSGFRLWAATDFVTSLGPFVMIRLLRLKPGDAMLQYIALAYVTFLFLKCFTLVLYLYANAKLASRNSIRAWVFVASLTVYMGFAAWIAQSTWPFGDAPHYLLLTHSLVVDHDIDLANNYRNGDYRSFFPPHLDEHAIRNSRGQALPIHDLGLSVLMIPGYILGKKTGALVELAVAAALSALSILELSLQLGAEISSAVLAWALFAFSTPILVFASQMSPEIIGAAILPWAVITFLRFAQRGRALYLPVTAFLAAILPWFSIRFWVFTGPLLVVIGAWIMTQNEILNERWRISRSQAFTCLVLPTGISVVVFAIYDKLRYGILLPNAGYVLDVRMQKGVFGFTPQIGFLGLMLDRAFGLFPIAPIYILSLVGVIKLWKKDRTTSAVILAPTIFYVLFVSSTQYWYGGWSPAARFLVSVAALFAPLAALTFSSRSARYLGLGLGTWTFLITFIQMAFPNTRYIAVGDATRGGVGVFFQEHFGVDPLTRLFPSFMRSAVVDYLVAAVWVLLMICATWWLAARWSEVRGNHDLMYTPKESRADFL